MAEVRYRFSWQLALAIVLVMTVAIVPVIIYFLDFKSLFLFVTGYFMAWVVMMLIALMGAFLLGLAVGHRAASKSDFSPFEVEMLKMREEVKTLKDLVHRHNQHHDGEQQGGPAEGAPEPGPAPKPQGTPEPPERPIPVEAEPEPRPPMAPGPEMQPVGKVRCSQCKTVIPLYSKKRPLEIKCTKCGKVGVLR
jgi:hypothetical protein